MGTFNSNDLENTPVSKAHLGTDPSHVLAALLTDDDNMVAKVEGTVGAEAANAIPVGLQLKSLTGKNLASGRRVRCSVLDAEAKEAASASFTTAETGSGTEVSTTAKAQLIVDLDANGAAEVTVTDVSGALAGTVYLRVEFLNSIGAPLLLPITFA